jgi:hypothetical protein
MRCKEGIKMRKLLLIVVSFILILSLIGCSKGETPKVSPAPKAPEIVSPIVGTWKYYKDVPKMPSYATWTLNFAKDGTYTTTGDMITSGSKSHAYTWGAKGTYSVTEKSLTLTREDEGTTRTFNIEIKEEKGDKQLIFRDNSGEVNVTNIGEDKTLYYTIFIKQN